MTMVIAFDEQAREAVRNGVVKLARAAKITFGPRGRNVVFEGPSGPVVTRDGVTVVGQVELGDPFENIGARMAREAASRTGDRSGDGTTTAVVLAEAIFLEGMKAVVAGACPIALVRGIERAVAELTRELRAMSIPVTDRATAVHVATVAANQDRESGRLVADVVLRIGRDGYATVEVGSGTETAVEWAGGFKFDRGFLSPHFATSPGSAECVLDRPLVLIVDGTLGASADLVPILEVCAKAGRPLLVVAEDVTFEALSLLVVNHRRGTLACCAVRSPELGELRKESLADLAAVAGTRVIGEAHTMNLGGVSTDDLGSLSRAVIDKESATLIADGRAGAVGTRAKRLRREIERAGTQAYRSRLERRLARLTGGAARILVGARTESEKRETKARLEDALHATRAAVEEGVVPGGGVALVRAASAVRPGTQGPDERRGYDAVVRACRAPLVAIAENAGRSGTAVCRKVAEGEGAFGYNAATDAFEDLAKAGVFDPARVTRTALENAASVTGLLLTSDVLIGEKAGTKGGR